MWAMEWDTFMATNESERKRKRIIGPMVYQMTLNGLS